MHGLLQLERRAGAPEEVDLVMREGNELRDRDKLPPTPATVEVTVERPPQLKNLEVTVECSGINVFEIGLEDGKPLAFFRLNKVDEAIAITSTYMSEIKEVARKRFSLPEPVRVKQLTFKLTIDDFSSLGTDEFLTDSDPKEFVALEVVIWLDGGWRPYRTILAPLEGKDRILHSEAYSILSQEMLDYLYETRISNRDE